MPVRNTEKRIPQIAGFSPAGLGQSIASPANPNVILVSYLSSPLGARRIQNYVVFVTDNAFAATVNSYDWIFTNGAVTNLTTSIGIAEFTPQNTGTLTVEVRLKNNANAVIATATLNQQVVALNVALETKIDADERAFPGAAHPDTSREMLNDLRPYVNAQLALPANDLYNKLICSLAYSRTLQIPAFRRNIFIEDYARVLNSNPAGFFAVAKDGFGVCKTRPQLLAMFLTKQGVAQPYISPPIELVTPANRAQTAAHATSVQNAFNLLAPDDMIDLFNLLRFPKSHFAMTQLILDGLEQKYFPAATIAQTLGVANDIKKLVTEYEQGLKAFPVTPSPFSTSVQRLMSNPVWAIPVALPAGAAPAGGAPPPGAPATVGIPEKLPSHTFIADSSTEVGLPATSQGFLHLAFVYHDNFGLNPQTTQSFEELITTLGAQPPNPISRLRIVSHFGGRSLAASGNGIIFLPFFTGQTHTNGSVDNQTRFWHFKYGISDEEGLAALFENSLLPSQAPDFLCGLTMNTQTSNTMTPVHRVIFRTLQARHDPVLTPFGLANSGNPSTPVLNIIKWSSNHFMLNNAQVTVQGANPATIPANIPALVQTTIANFIDGKLAALATPAGATTAANITALKNTIAAMNWNDLNANQFVTDIPFTVPTVYVSNHDALRASLAIVRNRLNDSFIDIRGCRLGQDRNFLRALRTFFGNVGHQPTISGPEWFQGFGLLGNVTFPGNSETLLDNFFNSGFSSGGIAGADVQREYSTWSGRIGINSQLSFWANLCNGDTFDFITLAWRSQLPPIGMDSVKLQGLAALSYPDTITRLRDIFRIPAATGPSLANLNTFNATFSIPLTTFQTIIAAVAPLTDASPQPTLQAQLTALTSLATPLAVVFPGAPAPLTKQYLNDCIAQLKQFIVTQSNITPFLSAISTRLADPKAGIRYMFGIGLALFVQAAASEGNNRLAYYPAEIDNALKSFMKINWEGPLPGNVTTAINNIHPAGGPVITPNVQNDPNDDDFNDTAKGLMYSSLSIDHNDTQNATNPADEFHQHIITEP